MLRLTLMSTIVILIPGIILHFPTVLAFQIVWVVRFGGIFRNLDFLSRILQVQPVFVHAKIINIDYDLEYFDNLPPSGQ